MIPKVIHYCWFGGNPLPEIANKCIESWRKYCPNYEIIEWNESNYDIYKHPYMKEAYEAKKWAFVSDYARLDIVFSNGGIYLDTDVELLRPIDDFLNIESFFASECTGFVATGLGFGAVQNSIVLKKMLDEYENAHFRLPSGVYDILPCPQRNTEPLLKMGYRYSDNDIWKAEGVIVYPPEYFCPINYDTKELTVTKNTISIHHYSGLWISKEERELNELIEEIDNKNNKIIAFIKRQKKKYEFSLSHNEVKNIFEYIYRKIVYKIFAKKNKRRS